MRGVDYGLLKKAAALRPNYNFVLVGPVVKADPAVLPKAENSTGSEGVTIETCPTTVGLTTFV